MTQAGTSRTVAITRYLCPFCRSYIAGNPAGTLRKHRHRGQVCGGGGTAVARLEQRDSIVIAPRQSYQCRVCRRWATVAKATGLLRAHRANGILCRGGGSTIDGLTPRIDNQHAPEDQRR